ncbi:MAG: FHA domain-containing protein, partial [Gordonia sp. (in: high G+C Gram-positive bacteria)]
MNTPTIAPLQVRLAQARPQVLRSTPATVGRTPENDVVVNHPLVSRVHLAFEWSDGWSVVDRGSTNGFFVNGIKQSSVRVDRPMQIRLGDASTGPLLELTPQQAAAPTIVPAKNAASAPPSRPNPAQQPAPQRP